MSLVCEGVFVCCVVGEECGKVKQASFYLVVWCLVCVGVFVCCVVGELCGIW